MTIDSSMGNHACLPTCTNYITPNSVEYFFCKKKNVVDTHVKFLKHKELQYLVQCFMRYGLNTETCWVGLGMHISHVVPQM